MTGTETTNPEPEESEDMEVVAHDDDAELAACCIVNWSNEL